LDKSFGLALQVSFFTQVRLAFLFDDLAG